MNHRPNVVEFDHLERILADVGTNLSMSGTRSARTAKAMFEAHMVSEYDRVGCFAYVGWPAREGEKPPDSAQQLLVYAAFARGAVAANVALGAMEPDEGFGLAAWRNPDEAGVSRPLKAIDSMKDSVAYAAHILAQVTGSGTGQLLPDTVAATSIALGYGLLRGAQLFASDCRIGILDGPKIVESIYGEIPNRCGGIAKGKDYDGKRLFPTPMTAPLREGTIYWQPWTRIASNPGSTFAGHELPDELLQLWTVEPKDPKLERKPFLIGLSLDFAQSRQEYASNPHRARTVMNRVLSTFEEMAEKAEKKQMFVSPRYGDGVAAVIVLEASDLAEVKRSEWWKRIEQFCKQATSEFERCKRLGLRVGMAVALDTTASAPRLAGIAKTCSPAVEPLAQTVVIRARECHRAKDSQPKPIKRATLWFRPENAGDDEVEVVL